MPLTRRRPTPGARGLPPVHATAGSRETAARRTPGGTAIAAHTKDARRRAALPVVERRVEPSPHPRFERKACGAQNLMGRSGTNTTRGCVVVLIIIMLLFCSVI